MRHPETHANALPLSDQLFHEPFYVTHAGWERVSPHQSYPRPGHPSCYGYTWREGRILGEFCLCMVTSGSGEIETKQGRRQLKAGQAWMYLPGEWHRHRPTADVGWCIYWINFNGSQPHRWLQEQAFQLDGNLVKLADAQLFERQLRRLSESVIAAGAKNSLEFSWQAIGLLSHFLKDIRSDEQPLPSKSGNPMVDSVMEYIWSHSHNRIGVPEVVAFIGINRRTLERRFNEITGSSLFNEIQRCRISRATLLLKETGAPHQIRGRPLGVRKLSAITPGFSEALQNVA